MSDIVGKLWGFCHTLRHDGIDYGNNFNEKNLRRMIQFFEVFQDKEIFVSLIRQLSWTHFREIIYLDDSLQCDFYAEMCRIERWNTRTLKSKIQGMLYERTAISKKPEELVKKELSALRDKDTLTPDLVFRDPYFLDFLGLKDTYGEKDLETAIGGEKIAKENQYLLLEDINL